MIRISIIIPIYKVEAYIQRCLESIINQTWNTDDAAIECILVDDCTPDNSMLMAQDMIKAYEGPIHFICLKHDINRGLSAARNTGTAKATGDYILYIDSDDYMAPNSLQTFIGYIKNNPDAEVIIGLVTKTPSNELNSRKRNQPFIISNQNDILYNLFTGDIYIEAWNKLIKRNILEKKQIQFKEGIFFEDVPWMYQLFSNVKQILVIPKITYFYYINPAGIMASSPSAQHISKAIESYCFVLKYLLENPPDTKTFHKDLIVDYLLFIHTIMTRAMHLLVTTDVNSEHGQHFLQTRDRLLDCVLKSRRIFIILFFLTFTHPFYNILKLKIFRKNYHRMKEVVRMFSHLTDFLH